MKKEIPEKMSDHRTILATAAVIQFLRNQPGEFTADEIRELGKGFHCDNDETDVRAVCITLACRFQPPLVKITEESGYEAFSWNRS